MRAGETGADALNSQPVLVHMVDNQAVRLSRQQRFSDLVIAREASFVPHETN